MPASLAEALESLYLAFAQYPRPEQMVGCGCSVCWDGRWAPAVDYDKSKFPYESCVSVPAFGGAKPLRSLQIEDFGDYSEAWFTTGTEDDFRYYFPRLVELASADPVDGEFDLGAVLAVARHFGVDEWPEHERAAVAALAEATWQEWVLGGASSEQVSNGFSAVAEIVVDMQPFLDSLTPPKTRAAASNLERLLSWEHDWLTRRFPFLIRPDGNQVVEQVRTSLVSPAAVEMLEQAARDSSDTDVIETLTESARLVRQALQE